MLKMYLNLHLICNRCFTSFFGKILIEYLNNKIELLKNYLSFLRCVRLTVEHGYPPSINNSLFGINVNLLAIEYSIVVGCILEAFETYTYVTSITFHIYFPPFVEKLDKGFKVITFIPLSVGKL